MKYNSQPVKIENYVMKHCVMYQCNFLTYILFKLSFSFLICARSLSLWLPYCLSSCQHKQKDPGRFMSLFDLNKLF